MYQSRVLELFYLILIDAGVLLKGIFFGSSADVLRMVMWSSQRNGWPRAVVRVVRPIVASELMCMMLIDESESRCASQLDHSVVPRMPAVL